MKVGKPKSKRVSVRLRHKIEKASANKQRKERREAKKNPQWRSRLKKDPGIPNLFPYKDKVLAEIEESKRRKEEEKLRKRNVAKAQKEGKEESEEEGDEELGDVGDLEEDEGVGEDMEEDTNPMAALLASAQARAVKFQPGEEEEEEDHDDDDDEGVAVASKSQVATKSAEPAARKTLPAQALADPIKAVTTLIARLEKTQEGMQQLLAYYQLPPLITAGSNTTTRFLVDVARKRGRLGRGGIPNLNAAALTVLGDLNEERLKLPALQQLPKASGAVGSKGDVQIVSQLAEPFRIEGLFGDGFKGGVTGDGEMEVEEA